MSQEHLPATATLSHDMYTNSVLMKILMKLLLAAKARQPRQRCHKQARQRLLGFWSYAAMINLHDSGPTGIG